MTDTWAVRSLGDVCDVLDSRRKPITKRDRTAGPYPYYGATGILDYVDGYLFDEKLVLLGEDGAKWGPGENSAFMVAGKIWVNNHAHVLRPHRDIVLDEWLVYFLNCSDLSRFISGLTVPKLNQANMRSIPVPVPPLKEQQRIVVILDEAFEGIAAVKAYAERNHDAAAALFKSSIHSSLKRGGTGWKGETLGDLCSIARGGSPRPIKSFLTEDPNGVNWVKISDATASGKYIFSTVQKIRPEGASRSRIVKDGDFLLSNSMSFGRPYIMRTSGCIHDGWLVLSDYAERLDQDFLYHLLGSDLVFKQFDRLAAGSTVRNLNKDLASRVRIPVPPLEVQRELARQFEAASERVVSLRSIYRRKAETLDTLKKSLLNEAFAGNL